MKQELARIDRPITASFEGRLALANPNLPTHEQQVRYDLTTQFAELVDGNMRTDFELRFKDGDLVGEDGRGMDEITSASFRQAEKTAELNPAFSYEVRRRKHEREEFEEAMEMAEGKGSNAMIIISDFPAELMDAKSDEGGYNVRRKQTMLRVLIRKPSGNIQMYSQSLDGSNRQALEAIYDQFGAQPKEGELLGQRIRTDVLWGQEAELVEEIRQTYDQSMSEQFGGSWYGGRRPVDYRNTYDFVCQQTDLVDHCIEMNSRGWLNDGYMYKIAATMQERFEKNSRSNEVTLITRENITRLRQEIMAAGGRAEQQGLSFSACGVTMRSGGRSGLSKGRFDSAGYGSKAFDDEDGNCEFVSKSCPECGAENVKTRVSRISENQKHISGSCGCSKIVND